MDQFIELFMVSPLLLAGLFFIAMLAGFIDALAGGGGLLTVPALLAAGMSPAQALATNKLQACGGSLSASIYFIRRKVVSLADQKLNILMTFIGSTSGALLVQHAQHVGLHVLNQWRAAGSARAVRRVAPDFADPRDLYWSLLFADAKTRGGGPAASSARIAVCPDRRGLRRLL